MVAAKKCSASVPDISGGKIAQPSASKLADTFIITFLFPLKQDLSAPMSFFFFSFFISAGFAAFVLTPATLLWCKTLSVIITGNITMIMNFVLM